MASRLEYLPDCSMEFFQEIDRSELDVDELKDSLVITNLPELCASIDTILHEDGNNASIYCVWGQFHLKREPILHGVRFALVNCPHALAWTITYHETRRKIVIHCTIDKTEYEMDFIDSIRQFILDWSAGLNRYLP